MRLNEALFFEDGLCCSCGAGLCSGEDRLLENWPHSSRMWLNEALFSTPEKTDCMHSSLMWLKYILTELQKQTLYRMLCVFFSSWKTREVKSTGRLSIDSNGHKNLKISAGLGGSSFDSRGGVVGGAIDLQDLSTFCESVIDIHQSCCHCWPQHLLWVSYRYTPVLLSLLTSAPSVSQL